jgi:peptide/nickel transport system substrate-binding protein
MSMLTAKRHLALAGLAVALAVTLSAPVFGPAPVMAQQPTRLVVEIPAEPVGLDPQQTSGSTDRIVYPVLFDRLFSQDATGKLVPQLTTKSSISSDGLVWTFDIRQGQQFHDGTPLNAAAIRASFMRLLDPKTSSPQRSSFADLVDDVRVVSEYQVAFKTKGPTPFLPAQLSQNTMSIVNARAAEAAGLAPFNRSPVGSGPFKLKEWVRGSRVVVERNPIHWVSTLRRGNVDEIEFRVIPDASSRAIGLETGELDFVTTLEPADAKRLMGNSNLTIYNVPRSRQVTLYPDFRKKPFNDLRVRQAVAYAINKQILVDTFLYGFGQVSNSPMQPGVPYGKAYTAIPQDVQRARALLREAGYAQGLSTTLMVPTGRLGGIQQTAQAVSEMLRNVGITVKLELMEHATWQNLTRKGPNESPLEISFWTWGNVIGDIDYSMRETFHSKNFAPRCCNRNFYKNAEVDRLIDMATTEMDSQKRGDLYARAQDLVWRDQAWIWLYDINHSSGAKKGITGVLITPTEWWDFREVKKATR